MRIAWTMIAAAALSCNANADTLWLHAASKHWDGGSYKETNPGLGIELPLADRWSVEAGLFRNSHGRPTNYAWGGYALVDRGVRVRLLAGAIDGYNGRNIEDGLAYGIIAASLEYRRARLTLLPGAVGFSLMAAEW